MRQNKSVDQLVEELIGREGRYTNHPSDRGGPTCWGITEAVARKHGYAGLMRDLQRAMAVHIYRAEYFVGPGFDNVYALSQPIAEEMFDTGVNMGAGLPGPWLQRILNALNNHGKDYPEIGVDGKLGPATMAALRSFLNRRGADGETVILRALNCLQGVRYLDITEKREQNEDFYFGWLLNRVEAA
ncbi:MAG TPA: glycosyl hydrolase 108 family protein [Telluria sp.]